ncbi:hypothetical protein FPRO05_10370 [Fusarium proliferatum]|uniref:Uncharacterized protein n=1 Tax=Gibberella intermedia TaxID=948311 RepID=A0A365NDF1_GIBIN|nr:hypothetical protein FPRO05_10370 [Fusarium proliferatum]
MPTTSSMSRGATRFALRDINTFKVAHLAQACESGKPKINFLIQGNAHPSEKEKMLKDHQQQLGKIDQKYRGEGRHPDHQGDGVMGADSFGLNISSPNDRDSYLEAGDEWEDVVPKSEKMEEHFAYVQAATSLQHPFDVPSGCDKRTMCILRMRKLARYFFAYRYTQDLPLEGSNLFTVQELEKWFICASSIHIL